ncbi:mercuric transport protein, MerE [Burkholderiales bacterium GJ-E10]|nr:mercuric transport protein, MerE [Burkholderiales bacterium GJ-E10]
MASPDCVESRDTPRWRGYAWGVLAALTCPCHLPILAAVLAGTTAGAFIGNHWGIAAVALGGLFFLSLARAIRAFRGGAWTPSRH